MVKAAIGCKSNLVSRGNVDKILGSELRNVSIAVLNRCSFHRWCSFTYRSQLEPVFLVKIMLVVTPLLGQGEKSSEDTVALEVHCLGLDSDFDRDEVHAGEVCSIIDTAGTFIASNLWIGAERAGAIKDIIREVRRNDPIGLLTFLDPFLEYTNAIKTVWARSATAVLNTRHHEEAKKIHYIFASHRFPFMRVIQNLVIQWASLMPLTSGRIQSYSVAGLGRNMHYRSHQRPWGSSNGNIDP